jgi:hypothetical protein
MRPLALSLIALTLAASPLHAQDFLGQLEDFVESIAPSKRAAPPPPPEPVDEAPVAPVAEETLDPPPLPRPRPEEAETPVEEVELEEEPAPEAAVEEEPEAEPEVVAEPEPEVAPEPDRIYQTACPALLSGVVVGEMLEPIADGICSERSPLLVSAVRVNGREIGLSSPVTTNCAMAGAFADWVGEVDSYAGAVLENPVATVSTGTSLMCRNRVGGSEGFVSEHGFANALDIVGFALADGTAINVEADWLPAVEPAGKLLRQAHGAACGRFTTVLGPEANAEHEDHLHLDLGCHGGSCTARICE